MTEPMHTPEQAAILALLDRIEAMEGLLNRASGIDGVLQRVLEQHKRERDADQRVIEELRQRIAALEQGMALPKLRHDAPRRMTGARHG